MYIYRKIFLQKIIHIRKTEQILPSESTSLFIPSTPIKLLNLHFPGKKTFHVYFSIIIEFRDFEIKILPAVYFKFYGEYYFIKWLAI